MEPCSHPRVFSRLDEIVDPDHTALVVIDVQNDFVHPKGFTGLAGVPIEPILAAVAGINLAISLCRAQGVPVFFVQEVVAAGTVLPPYLTRCGSLEACPAQEGTWGAEWFEGLDKPAPGEAVFQKPSYDGFQDTQLNVALRSRGIRTCLYVGIASNVCVEATALHGFLLGYYTVLLENGTAGDSAAGHASLLAKWATFYGPVTTTGAVRDLWSATRAMS
ncbi:MAG: isochorismatase family cysteine hydrolase [Candidatus Dormiibacterota bacterium]